MNEMHNYSIDKEKAIKQMLDMNKRATQSRQTQPISQNKNKHTMLSSINLPFDSDTLTILALMFILYKENCDITLIFALAYILI